MVQRKRTKNVAVNLGIEIIDAQSRSLVEKNALFKKLAQRFENLTTINY